MTRLAITMMLLGLLAASALASDSRVSNLSLTYSEAGTVAAIEVSGQVRFAHQTEIAKDGKPYRVIVDILSATHHLGAKVFEDVPDCIVSSIRTSQYSVKPEKVVRVVFDVKHETAYQIAAEGNAVRVTFPDRETPGFSAWNSRSRLQSSESTEQHARGFTPNQPVAKKLDNEPVKEKRAGRLNKAINDDRLTSLEPQEPTSAHQGAGRLDTQITFESPTPPEVGAPIDELAEWDSVQLTGTARKYCDGDMFAGTVDETPQPVASTSPDIEKPAEPAPPVQEQKKTEPRIQKPEPTRQDNVELVRSDQPAAPPAPVEAEQTASTKSVVAQKQAAPGEPVRIDASTGKAVNPAKSEQRLAAAEEKQPESDEGTIKTPSSRRSTARFRRSPSMSRKLKGTMVAEFPTRLVVKYRTAGKRDPFATLINEARLKSGAMEDRIPNVDGLRLVGVIESSGGQNSALFEDSEGYGYILKAGDKVRRGYVLRVESDRAYFQIFEYGWSRTVALNIED